jgi:ABC-type lipoprotein release transport system permease subunit
MQTLVIAIIDLDHFLSVPSLELIAATAAMLVIVAIAAWLAPARRAALTQPNQVLQAE